MRLILIVLSGLLLAPLADAATYYKWVDKNGVVQYSATPPKGQDTTPVKADAKAARAPQAKPTDAMGVPVAEPDAATVAAEKQALALRVACEAARNNLAVLTSNTVVTRIEPGSTEQVSLTTEQIETERARANEQIAANCIAES